MALSELDVTLIIVVSTIMSDAADMCVIAPSPRDRLCWIYSVCSRYSFENDILYNPTKASCLVVEPSGFHLKCPDVYINTNKLDYVGKLFKYLGVIICDD